MKWEESKPPKSFWLAFLGSVIITWFLTLEVDFALMFGIGERKRGTSEFCGRRWQYGELEPLAEAEKAVCLQKIAQLHRNTGHGPVEHLVKALKARHTDPRVVAFAREFVCPVCHELCRQVPRPQVSLEPLPPKWKVMQGDSAFWVHPKTG